VQLFRNSNFVGILVLTALKVATWVAETSSCPLCRKITSTQQVHLLFF